MIGTVFAIGIQELELIKDGFLYIREMLLVGLEGVAFLVHVGILKIASKVSFKASSMRDSILLDSRTVVAEFVSAEQVRCLFYCSAGLCT